MSLNDCGVSKAGAQTINSHCYCIVICLESTRAKNANRFKWHAAMIYAQSKFIALVMAFKLDKCARYSPVLYNQLKLFVNDLINSN